MALSISSVKITGNPGPSGWAQVHEFVPEEPLKLARRGSFYAVIATSKFEEGVENVIAGRELLARLHEEYYGTLEDTAFNTLKAAVSKVAEEFRQAWGDVEIAAAVYLDGIFYTAAAGGSEVSILRNGSYAKIIQSNDEIAAASGYPRSGDTIALVTKPFCLTVASGVIKAAMASGDLTAALETIVPQVHGKSNSGNMAAIFIRFKDADEIKINQGALREESSVKVEHTQPSQLLNKLDRVKDLLPRVNLASLKTIFDKKQIYVRQRPQEGFEEQSRGRKTSFAAAAILLLLLVLSIGFGIRQKNLNGQKAAYQEKLTQAQHSLDEAKSLSSVSPEQARSLFAESKSIVNELVSSGVKDAQLDKLSQQLQNDQESLMGEYRGGPEQYLDLGLLSSGFSGDNLVATTDQFYILDKKGKKVVRVTYDTKKTEVVAGPAQITDPQGLVAYEDRAFVIENDGINEVGDAKETAITKDWNGQVLAYAYAGNIYLLNKGGSMIYRYVGNGSNFSSKQSWLATGTTVDLSNAEKMVIDGSIWVLTSTDKLIRFSQGNLLSFETAGVFPELTQIDSISSTDTSKYLYLLDKGNKRIVVVNKDGLYKAQYIADEIAAASDILVSEENKLLILLTGDKLYSVELKHL